MHWIKAFLYSNHSLHPILGHVYVRFGNSLDLAVPLYSDISLCSAYNKP